MPPQGRLTDKSQVPADAHGCPACPHTCIGPAVMGSPNVMVNSLRTLRFCDTGTYAACYRHRTLAATVGSGTVFINSMAAHRQGDMDTHCGGVGRIVEG
ncbi:hypothetical protein BH11MYX2_BH11MYX2_37980 [soil metagenome]